MQRRVPRTFWRFLLSYLSLLLLLVLVLFLANGLVMSLNQQNSQDTAFADLQNVAAEFEGRLTQMQTIVDMLAYDDAIIYRDLAEDPVAAIAMQRKLKNYTRSTLYLHDMLLYVNGVRTIYAASSTYWVDTYARRVLRYENWPPEDFIATLDGLDHLLIRPVEPVTTISGIRQELMTCVYQLYSNVSTGYASVLFQIQKGEIDQILRKASPSAGGNVLILDGEGRLLYGLHPMEEEGLAALAPYAGGQESASRVERLLGVDQMLSVVPSPGYGLTFLSLIPRADAMEKAAALSRLLNLVLLMVLAGGVGIILYFMRLNYLPIKRLGDAMREKGQTVSPRQSEVDAAFRLIEDLQTQQEDLQKRMRSNTEELKDTLLTSLLSGSLSLVQYNGLAGAYDYGISRDHFRVVLIRAHQATWEQCTKLFPQMISSLEMALPQCQVRCVAQRPDRLLVLIASGEEMEGTVREQVEHLLGQEPPAGGIRLNAVIGVCTTSWLRIHDSYLGCDRLMLEHEGRLRPGEVIAAKQQTIYYPAYEMNSLMQTVESGDVAEFMQVVRTLCSMVKRKCSLTTARMIGYDVLRTALDAPLDANPAFLALKGELREQMAAVMVSKDTAEISRVLFDRCSAVAAFMEPPAPQKGREDPVVARVIAYVHERFAQPDFSIQMVAEAFAIKQNNLSQQFKRVTGQTPLQYVNHLRVEKGKELLAHTNMPLREVAAGVGFINESTFIRKFKAEVGMTPGEYRRNISGGPTGDETG